MGTKKPTWPSRIASRRPWPLSRPRSRHCVRQGGSRSRSNLEGNSTRHGLTSAGPAAHKGQGLETGPSSASGAVVLTRSLTARSGRRKKQRPWKRRQKWLTGIPHRQHHRWRTRAIRHGRNRTPSTTRNRKPSTQDPPTLLLQPHLQQTQDTRQPAGTQRAQGKRSFCSPAVKLPA